jgi:murein L,D-transpeptidase YcbB/YkuD
VQIAAPAWTSQSLADLLAALREAPAHGLDASDLVRQAEGATPADGAQLHRIALTYAKALARGVADPKELHETFTLETNQRDLAGELGQALRAGRLGAWLTSLAPDDADYRALSAAYLEARAAAGAHPKSAELRQKARTLALNLERRRWLARNAPETRIDVNVAAARLWFFKDGVMLDSRKVVAGAPAHETPLLQASFHRIVTNPPWHVPTSIARREILPKGAGYMARHGMRMVDGRVVQEPGPDSALGQVKFDLQDDQAMYLHDTPSQSAFERTNRNLSHGCIRVEDAVGFARLVAESFGVADQFEDRLATGDTGSVSLGADVPVRLLYETAYVEDGAVTFARDPYGYDAKLADALGVSDPDAMAIPVSGRTLLAAG